MHFTLPSITALVALAGLTTATPLVSKRQAGTTTVTPPNRYKLQTKVYGGLNDTGSNKNGLYLYSYHTGAGLGDVGLTNNETVGWEGYLNGTQQLFTYPQATFPWPLKVGYGEYQSWTVTTISVADGPGPHDPGFFFNETGLQWNGTGNGGWIACDWWHGVPQLFSLVGYLYGGQSLYGEKYPTSCSKVQLYPIAI